jgi:hypothetical protein
VREGILTSKRREVVEDEEVDPPAAVSGVPAEREREKEREGQLTKDHFQAMQQRMNSDERERKREREMMMMMMPGIVLAWWYRQRRERARVHGASFLHGGTWIIFP